MQQIYLGERYTHTTFEKSFMICEFFVEFQPMLGRCLIWRFKLLVLVLTSEKNVVWLFSLRTNLWISMLVCTHTHTHTHTHILKGKIICIQKNLTY